MKNKFLVTIMLLSLLTFLSVTFLFTSNNGFMYDETIANAISKLSSSTNLQVMEVISLFGSSEIILLLTGLITVIFLVQRNWSHIIFFLTVSVGGVALNFMLKVLFQRERPGGEVSHIEVFNFSLDIPSYSFPSGHTMRATILLLFFMYMIITFLHNSVTKITLFIISIVVMLGVALSRLFLEAHFFSDTIAAMSISVTWFSICLLIFKRYNKRRNPTYRPVIGK